jgi:hypothetical protein
VSSLDAGFLYTTFETGAGETMLNAGDSGGGVFIQQAGTWRLAGINYGATIGPWDLDADHSSFLPNANIHNPAGMYYYNGSAWQLVTVEQAYSIHSRISTSASTIQSMLTVAVPEPSSLMLVLPGLALVLRRRRA